MFQRKSRRFRRRPNGRGHQHHRKNGHTQSVLRNNSFSNNRPRNNFRSTQNPEKLLEKYNALAKEAMSVGDKTSCENFLQHADHFTRIIKDRNKTNNVNKPVVEGEQPTQNSGTEQEAANPEQEVANKDNE